MTFHLAYLAGALALVTLVATGCTREERTTTGAPA
ncbi:MAG: hypothetical protein JWM26_502, partial [Betaproteobacteria bacterium]|nr:hypothetical protein [Betaproteobacteria bacterium]